MQGRAETSGRADDEPDKIGKRIEAFCAEPNPVINHLRSQEKRFFQVDGEADEDSVQAEFVDCVRAILQQCSSTHPS